MNKAIILILVVMLLTLGVFSPKVSAVTPTGKPTVPDVVTSNVIWLNQSVKTTVQGGTFGIVVWTGPNCFALDIPGGYDGTEDIVVFSRTVPFIASGVTLKLEGSSLRVYFTHTVATVLQWNDLSVDSQIKGIYSQDLFVGRVLRVYDTGAWESETSGNLLVKKSFYYKIYLTTTGEVPFDPPTGRSVVMATIIVPDYDAKNVQNLVGDYVYLSLMRGNYMYFWPPLG